MIHCWCSAGQHAQMNSKKVAIASKSIYCISKENSASVLFTPLSTCTLRFQVQHSPHCVLGRPKISLVLLYNHEHVLFHFGFRVALLISTVALVGESSTRWSKVYILGFLVLCWIQVAVCICCTFRLSTFLRHHLKPCLSIDQQTRQSLPEY